MISRVVLPDDNPTPATPSSVAVPLMIIVEPSAKVMVSYPMLEPECLITSAVTTDLEVATSPF